MIFIFLLIFLLFSFASFYSPKRENLKSILFISFGFILIFISGLREENVARDYWHYVNMFNNYENALVEPAFKFLSYFIQTYISSNPLYIFIVFAVLGVSLKFIAIKQLTDLWFLSLVIYLSHYYILHEMTQIRVGIASAFLLLSIKPIYERNWRNFLFYAFLGFMFHSSALVIFPLWF